MYLVAIGWLYVALMMAVAEATATNGSVLGALITFVLYGLAPVGLVLYLMGAPSRRKANKARENAQWQPASTSNFPDGGGETATATEPGAVAPMRKEP